MKKIRNYKRDVRHINQSQWINPTWILIQIRKYIYIITAKPRTYKKHTKQKRLRQSEKDQNWVDI